MAGRGAYGIHEDDAVRSDGFELSACRADTANGTAFLLCTVHSSRRRAGALSASLHFFVARALQGARPMVTATRRTFLLSTAAAAVVRVAHGNASETSIGAGAKVRQPAVGQTWRYAKHDFFTGALVDTQVDRVSAVGRTIEIESHSETTQDTPIKYPSWGSRGIQRKQLPLGVAQLDVGCVGVCRR